MFINFFSNIIKELLQKVHFRRNYYETNYKNYQLFLLNFKIQIILRYLEPERGVHGLAEKRVLAAYLLAVLGVSFGIGTQHCHV